MPKPSPKPFFPLLLLPLLLPAETPLLPPPLLPLLLPAGGLALPLLPLLPPLAEDAGAPFCRDTRDRVASQGSGGWSRNRPTLLPPPLLPLLLPPLLLLLPPPLLLLPLLPPRAVLPAPLCTCFIPGWPMLACTKCGPMSHAQMAPASMPPRWPLPGWRKGCRA